MPHRRRLVLPVLVLALVAGIPGLAGAAPTGGAEYSVVGTTLFLTPADGSQITLYPQSPGEFAVETVGTWAVRSGGSSGSMTVTGSALTNPGVTISAIRINDDTGPSSVTLAGAVTGSIPWQQSIEIVQTQADSVALLAGTDTLTGPLMLGALGIVVDSSNVVIDQDITSTGDLTVRSTSAVILGGAITLTGGTASLSLPALELRGGLHTLSAATVDLTGDVQARIGCDSVRVGICSVPLPSLAIGGETLITSGTWSGLETVTAAGTAILGGDVATRGGQTWDGPVYVNGPAALTLTGTWVATLEGIGPYLGSCGSLVISGCSIAPNTPAPVLSNLTIDGGWVAGGPVTAAASLTVTGLTTAFGTGASSTLSTQTGGPQELRGGLVIGSGRAAVLGGSTVTIGGMPDIPEPASIGTASCSDGPLTVAGALVVTAAVDCLDSLIVNGPATLAADVTTARNQTYLQPVTVALGAGTRRLQAGAGHQVQFPDTTVAATWSAAEGAVTGYTTTISPAGQSCAWIAGPLTCSFGAVSAGADLTFSVTPLRPAATLPASTTALQTSVVRRTVARGSRTRLAGLLRAPASLTGTRVWSERGPCSIRAGRLIAPQRAARCTVTLRVVQRKVAAWSGRAIVTIR